MLRFSLNHINHSIDTLNIKNTWKHFMFGGSWFNQAKHEIHDTYFVFVIVTVCLNQRISAKCNNDSKCNTKRICNKN